MVQHSLQCHSHFVDRLQRIVLDKFSLQTTRLSCRVPQGSGLGQGLFYLYISPLEDITMAHGLNAVMNTPTIHSFTLLCHQAIVFKCNCHFMRQNNSKPISAEEDFQQQWRMVKCLVKVA